MITNMTESSPAKILWKFSLPLLLSVVFQQLYNVVDSIVAGQFIGVDALAAVGASYPITMIFMAVATGSNIGCSVVISQFFGANAYEKMKTAISTSIISTLALAILLAVSGLFGCSSLMKLLQTPDNIFAASEQYLQIYIFGLLFLFLYNICTGVFTALGDSKTPLYFLIASSVGNIVLDIWFVKGFSMGVEGVAWATFIAQGAASLLALFTLRKRLKGIQTRESYPLFSSDMLLKISKVAIPSILQQSFVSVGNLLIQGLVNSFGSSVVAGYSAAIKLNTFAVTCFTTLANGLSSFTAQNIGAGKLERVKKGFHAGAVMAICVAIPFIAAFTLFGSQMMGIFMSTENTEVVSVGIGFLVIVAPFYLAVAIKLIADAVLRGSGAMLYFMITTFSDLILRVILSYVLADIFKSPAGIWMSWPIGWILSAALSCIFYAAGVWRKKTVLLK